MRLNNNFRLILRFFADLALIYATSAFLALHLYTNLVAVESMISFIQYMSPSILRPIVNRITSSFLSSILPDILATAITWRKQPKYSLGSSILLNLIMPFYSVNIFPWNIFVPASAKKLHKVLRFAYWNRTLSGRQIVHEKFNYALLHAAYFANKIRLFLYKDQVDYANREADRIRLINQLYREREVVQIAAASDPINTKIADYYLANPTRQDSINFAINRDLYEKTEEQIICPSTLESLSEDSKILLTLATNDNINFNFMISKDIDENRNWLDTHTADFCGSTVVARESCTLKDIKAKLKNLLSEPVKQSLWLPNFYALRARVITDENFTFVKKNFYKLTSLTAI